MEKEKVCPFFLLENSRPLSPWGPLDSLSTCLGNDSLNYFHYGLIFKRYSSDSESNSESFGTYNVLAVSGLKHDVHVLVHSFNKYLNSYSVQNIVIDTGGITVKTTT